MSPKVLETETYAHCGPHRAVIVLVRYHIVSTALVSKEDAALVQALASHEVPVTAFDDGADYVGKTRRSVLDRIEEHFGATGPRGTPDRRTVPIDERMESGIGTFRIMQRLAAGATCSVEVLASGLTEDEARTREWSEIAKLQRPSNTAGPVRARSDPLANESRIAIMRSYHKRNESRLLIP